MQLVIMLLLGTIGMLVCNLYQRKQYALSVVQCVLFTVLLTAVGVAGAKLMFFFESGCKSWDGISFFGSVFLIPLMMPVIGCFFRLKAGQSLDLCAPCVAVMIATLRVNCFLSGCCGGWQVCIGSLCFQWPTQIMESLGDVAILYFLLNCKKAKVVTGIGYPWFLILYGVMRFVIEFLRDTSKNVLLLSRGQWFSVCSIMIGVIIMVVLRRKKANAGNS